MYGSKPIVLVEKYRAGGPTAGSVLDELGIHHNAVRVSNAREGLAYLRESTSTEPSVILMDSPTDSIDVLDLVRAVKQDERLRSIPVVALTASGDVRMVNETFDLGAAGYVVKPSDHQAFVETVRAIHRYWTLSLVPSRT